MKLPGNEQQIMRAHTNDEGELEGKRIASEAGRRYIMTSPGKSKSNTQDNHAADGKAAAGAGVGSRAAADGSEVGELTSSANQGWLRRVLSFTCIASRQEEFGQCFCVQCF